ncbi:MAG: hypothetical protein V3R69_01500 [candidate division NC10 bacterium]|jgi:methyl-accepting chemotaxis protein|nr:methyl-accepting chemotaxis protein [candidate division NC10 bacterium]MCZ6552116.1 hypothetical protein [candidate division NC10 bacterium]
MGQKVSFLRRRYNVHPIQRTYFSHFLAPLLFFAFFLILLAFLPLDATLQGAGPGPENAQPLGQVHVLWDFRIWLALLISMFASGLLSYHVTNKFAGPLYRIEQTLRKTKEGDLPLSVRIRSGDELQELVELLDGTFKRFASALIAINEQQTLATKELTAVAGKVKPGSDGEITQALAGIGSNLREVESILANFKLPTGQAPNPEPPKE